MKATSPSLAGSRLAGVLACALFVACDSGAPSGKPAAPAKAAPTKSEPAKVEPAKVEPAKVEPVPEPATVEPAKVEPVPEPAKVEPVAPVDPGSVVAAPAEPSPVPAAGGSTPIALGPNAELLRLVLAKDVVDRKPVDPGTVFASGTKVNLFIESRNEGEADIPLRVTWENVASGRRSPPVGVKIPVRKLNRTRAFRTLKIKGEHRCILLGEGDKELAVLPFTIE